MTHTLKRLAVLGLALVLGLSAGSLAQDTDTQTSDVTASVDETVVIELVKNSDFAGISEADITAGTLVNANAITITVEAITNFTVDANLTATATSSGTADVPPGSSLLLAASAAGGSAISDTAFGDSLPATISLTSAFSGTNNADGTGESSDITLTLDMDALGDREQLETLTYSLEFVVTET